MRKHKNAEESGGEGSPAWMNTYGDMVTLMLTFFVLLFSFSTINAKKWEKIVQSFTGITVSDGSGGSGLADGSAVPQQSAANTETGNRFDALYEAIKSDVAKNGLDGMLEVVKENGIITVRMKDSALFDSGKATIKKNSLKVLNGIMDLVAEYENDVKIVRIEGHTDNRPISNSYFKNNWDLSVARAISVLEYLLQRSAMPPDKLSAAGFGEYHPIDTNETPEGRARNRRVDFIIEGLQ